ncbi:ABC transporter substrate-binding protein [Kribbella italica]|uniref:Multiple sugar transport system substrate-binding protein n=1 Tax=Kribbella italica TaxID=1540520 RepID=A0A7W9MXB8_9ACTN|nr:sugar ABC transporter substrate-binding protein [Kribbella italica]MBB5838938.1 multiple sugar transport system substrate-binding protein [Kribbella italica]
MSPAIDRTSFSLPLSRRGFLRAAGGTALAAAAGGALTACGGDDDQGSATKELSLVYMGTAEEQAAWNKLFAKFTEKHPEIKLKAEGVPGPGWGEFFNKLSTRLAGGQVPDVIQVATEGQRLFASKGLLAPLDDYIAKDQAVIDEYYADLDPNLIEWNKKYSSTDGKTYYLPGEFNTMCMWYSKDLFAKAGVPEPTARWTWDDFRTACEQIKAKTGAFGYAAGPEYFAAIMPWLLTNGTSSFSDDWSTPTLNDAKAIEAAEFNRALVADKLSPPPGGQFDAPTALAQGKLAMFGGGRWPIISIRNLKAQTRTGIVPWPTKVEQGSPVGWNGYPIMKASKKKDDAWTFVKFLISAEGSSFFAQLGGTIVPARKSIANSKSFLDNAPKGTESLYQALSYATPIPSPDKGTAVQKAIEDGWKQVLTGNASPADALGKAQTALEGLV